MYQLIIWYQHSLFIMFIIILLSFVEIGPNQPKAYRPICMEWLLLLQDHRRGLVWVDWCEGSYSQVLFQRGDRPFFMCQLQMRYRMLDSTVCQSHKLTIYQLPNLLKTSETVNLGASFKPKYHPHGRKKFLSYKTRVYGAHYRTMHGYYFSMQVLELLKCQVISIRCWIKLRWPNLDVDVYYVNKSYDNYVCK